MKKLLGRKPAATTAAPTAAPTPAGPIVKSLLPTAPLAVPAAKRRRGKAGAADTILSSTLGG